MRGYTGFHREDTEAHGEEEKERRKQQPFL